MNFVNCIVSVRSVSSCICVCGCGWVCERERESERQRERVCERETGRTGLRALIRVEIKINQVFFIFNKRELSVNRKDLRDS